MLGRSPGEKLSDGVIADVRGKSEPIDEMIAREPEPSPVGDAVEQDGSQQKLLAVDQHI